MTMQFCKECSNLLYPKADGGVLQFICQRCDTTADPVSPEVVSLNFCKTHSNMLTARKHLLHDPTLPRYNIECRNCSYNECVSYMEASEEKALNSYYVCSRCFYEWNDE